MPVFNEMASVRKVVIEWFQEVENWTEDFVFLAINDGSTDNTSALPPRLRQQLGSRLEVLDQERAGHGQSCIHGYRLPAHGVFRMCSRLIPTVNATLSIFSNSGDCATSTM